MLLLSGMAVDLMRLETNRTRVQNAIDGAVLAAANLNQTGDCETLIRDFFEKSGLEDQRLSVRCNDSTIGAGELVGRQVAANYDLEVDTFFMNLLGIETLKTVSVGAAAEGRQAIEISLVLDISLSMRGEKITNLKAAVEGFLQEVLKVTCDSEGENCIQSVDSEDITINIIPYGGHVNPGPELFSLLGGNRWHAWSSCKEVTVSDFDDADLPDASSHQLPHWQKYRFDETWDEWGWCPQASGQIMTMQNDYETLNDHVQNFMLFAGTGSDIGMKYGLALLNPTSQDEVAALSAMGKVESRYSLRPSNWEDDTVKIVVLMTDGGTTQQARPRMNVNGTWENWNYDRLDSLFVSMADVPIPYEELLFDITQAEAAGEDPPEMAELDDATQDYLDDLGSFDGEFELLERSEVEDLDEARRATRTSTLEGVAHSRTVADDHILDMCDEAKAPVFDTDGTLLKNDRAIVYTIAFKAGSRAEDIMRRCATTESYYFNIQTLNIAEAFEAISANITKLRLTN